MTPDAITRAWLKLAYESAVRELEALRKKDMAIVAFICKQCSNLTEKFREETAEVCALFICRQCSLVYELPCGMRQYVIVSDLDDLHEAIRRGMPPYINNDFTSND